MSILTAEDVRDRLRDKVTEHGTQAAAARALGVSQSYFSDLLAGRRDLSAAVCEAVGVERVVEYRERAR